MQSLTTRVIFAFVSFLALPLFIWAQAAENIVKLQNCDKLKRTAASLPSTKLVDLQFDLKEYLIHPSLEASLVDEYGTVIYTKIFSIEELRSGVNHVSAEFPALSTARILSLRVNDRLCFASNVQIPQTQMASLIPAPVADAMSCSLRQHGEGLKPQYMLICFVIFCAVILISRRRNSRQLSF